jgi:hypothetical protein
MGKTVKKDKTGQIEVKVIPDSTLPPRRLYSNLVNVQNTPTDMTLRFCDATPIYDPQSVPLTKGAIVHHIPVVAEIVIPIGLAPSLSEVIREKYEEFKKHYEKK